MLTLKTRLEPLRTLHEARVGELFVDVWVIEIPTQLANNAASLLKPLLAGLNSLSPLHHLRRLVTKPHLPPSFRSKYGIAAEKNGSIFLLFIPSHLVAEKSVIAALKPSIPHRNDLPRLYSTTVPMLPPQSVEQAQTLSESYWPCVYNPASKTIQQAPPLQQLRSTLIDLEAPRLEKYLDLAKVVGHLSAAAGFGRNIGAVVVDPAKNEVIATAGDARWWTSEGGHIEAGHSGSEGRPEHHALMRAIAMVAHKGVRNGGSSNIGRSHDLNGLPLNDIERIYFFAPERQIGEHLQASDAPAKQSCPRSDPYLCNGFDIYLTHEPCTCCSMAMIHSRFRACVFIKDMPVSGGLSAETRQGRGGYGLFWRKELNWRVITFQYRGESEDVLDGPAQLNFHA